MKTAFSMVARTAVCAGFFSIASSAAADGQYVTGKDWNASTEVEKLAYILGIANLMSADYELQRKGGRAGGSAIPQLFRATEDVTVQQAVAAIDTWYSANPDKTDEVVLDVIWLTLVENE